MGAACSAPAEDLEVASQEDIERIRSKGHLPCLAVPAEDLKRRNNLDSVYVAEYENGTELTFLFRDEDRPNPCEDFMYDTIRRPLFGRRSDIETIIIIKEVVVFPGTYAGEQTWSVKKPGHEEKNLELSSFERRGDNEFVLWTNTWNHLFGEINNNKEKDIKYCSATIEEAHGQSEPNYVLRMGTRKEVDARFHGCIPSLKPVMTKDREAKLGARLH